MNKDLENKILDVADLIYNTGYVAGSVESRPMGYEDGYKYGLTIAWKVAKTINTMDYWILEDVFKCKPSDIYNMSASEALEKINEFENEEKGTCDKCVHSKCNTCVHRNEDNICCGCVNDSEYEEEPEQTEKRCIDCRHNTTSGYCLLRIDGGRCVDRDKWEPKQTEEQPKQSCENCINKNTCSLKCPEHVKVNGCRSWIPKQTNDKIKLGDEVIHETGSRGIVVGIGNGKLYLLMRDYDMPQKVSKEGYTKTGRYFPQIQELRDQLH